MFIRHLSGFAAASVLGLLVAGPVLAERERPYLGVRVDLENKKGFTVLEVIENTPAAKAGLLVGDVITKLAGCAMRDADDLTTVLKSKKPDDVVEVEIKRGDDIKTLTLKLGKKS